MTNLTVVLFPKKKHTIVSSLTGITTNLMSLSYLMKEEGNSDCERVVMAASLLSIVVHNLEKNK